MATGVEQSVPTPRVGALFAGRYLILREIGRGGMGVVFEVRDERTERKRALKVLLETLDADPAARARFARETTMLAGIRSEHLVEVADAGVDEVTGSPFMVVELLDGEDLGAVLAREGPLSIERVADILAQVAKGLRRVHERGIVHRDLKPQNLFQIQDDQGAARIKILDFGIAKATETLVEKVATTAPLGTPLYMAPEQLNSEHVLSARTDVYALGQVAFTLLTGRPYFDVSDRPGVGILAVLNEIGRGAEDRATVRAKSIGANLPVEIDEWFARATKPQPAARFESAMDLAQSFARSLGLSWPPKPFAAVDIHRASTRPFRLPAKAHDAPSPAAIQSASKTERRRWLLFASLSICVVSLTAGVLLLRMRGGKDSTTEGQPGSSSPTLANNPLSQDRSRLACIPFAARGVTEPTGWLGAAAANLACRRADLWLGGEGVSERTLAPAQLLDLPTFPVEDFPVDPYGEPDARARALRAAEDRADVILDGFVEVDTAGFRVTIRVTAGNATLETAEARGASLRAAVHDAVALLVKGGTVPRTATRSDIAAWTFASAPEQLILWDEIQLDPTLRPERCRALPADLSTGFRLMLQSECAFRGFGEYPTAVIDRTSPAMLALTLGLLANQKGLDDLQAKAAIDELDALLAKQTTPLGEVVVGLALASHLSVREDGIARTKALIERRIRLTPRDPMAWQDLNNFNEDLLRRELIARASAAWAPAESSTWLLEGLVSNDKERNLLRLQRAYELDRTDVNTALEYAKRLLIFGETDKARQVGVALHGLGPQHAMAAAYLDVLFDSSQSRPRRAFALALTTLERADEVGTSADYYLVTRALRIARVLGRTRELADLWAARFAGDQPRLVDGGTNPVCAFALICLYASKPNAERCLKRLRQVYPNAADSPNKEFLDGALALVEGKPSEALKRWQPLVPEPTLLPFFPADLIESAGNPELAAHIDESNVLVLTSKAVNGFGMEDVRQVLRLARRGAKREAAERAKAIVRAWSAMDAEPPALRALRPIAQLAP